jgi:putative tricarboxylic transport membrane protein
MAIRVPGRFVAVLAAAALATSACGASRDDASSGASEGGATAEAVSGLSILVPNSPGSGYDTTARALAKAAEDAGLAETIQVSNVPGAGGTVGLQRLVNEEGNGDMLMQMGLGVVGAEFTNKSEASLQETTPIAKLIEEAEAIVVPADSPYPDLQSFLDAWKADPGAVPIGGASNPGGPDHLTPMLLAEAAGIDPKTVNYVAYDGGGELLAALLGSQVAAGATGVGEVAEQAAAGDVRILAVTSAEPVEGIDAPTLTEAGIDLEFTNWRGIVAPPGISPEDQEKLTGLVEDVHASEEWKQTLETQGWTDAYSSGEEFAQFLQSENERVRDVLTELGLA